MEIATIHSEDCGLTEASSRIDQLEKLDLSFLPPDLAKQCCNLIQSYHEVHGYACLPDILWKSRLGPFIEKQKGFRQILKKASTTRSAKKANEGFVQIAASILSMEILACNFAGWSALYPESGAKAEAVLRLSTRGSHMPLMDFYLYPPKHLSSAAVARLTPPANRREREAAL
jgi:hypothetical protein